jgi:uncharacterized protein (DUF433 family)
VVSLVLPFPRSPSHDERTHRVQPSVLQGKPVVRGTRIPVEGILRELSEGATEADLLDAYPRLTRDDIQAVLRYAADSVAHDVIVLPHAG